MLQEFSTQDCCNLEQRLDLRTTMVVLPIRWDQKLERLVVHGLNGVIPCLAIIVIWSKGISTSHSKVISNFSGRGNETTTTKKQHKSIEHMIYYDLSSIFVRVIHVFFPTRSKPSPKCSVCSTPRFRLIHPASRGRAAEYSDFSCSVALDLFGILDH